MRKTELIAKENVSVGRLFVYIRDGWFNRLLFSEIFLCSCSSASSSFRDSYGFIRGARESESELFHFLCRELKQYYSSFYQVTFTNLRIPFLIE